MYGTSVDMGAWVLRKWERSHAVMNVHDLTQGTHPK